MADYHNIVINTSKSLNDLKSIIGDNVDLNVFFTFNNSQNSKCEQFFLYSSEYVIPVCLNQKGPFKSSSFLTEPCHYNDNGGEETAFLDAVCHYLKETYHVQWIMETPASALFPVAPTGALAIPFGSHIVNLVEDVDVLWSKVHSKHRNVIKKAEKDGVEIVKGTDDKILEDYHSIDIETWERSNVKANSVEDLKKEVQSMSGNIIFYMAYKDGVPQAGAIFYYNQVMSYYMHGASRNHSYTGSSNLLHWVAMQDMKAAGVKRYSFVGARINEDPDSKYHGIQRFKERFGGELFVGKRFKVIFNPFMYKLFVLLASTKQSIRNKRWRWYKDSIDVELPKWKN